MAGRLLYVCIKSLEFKNQKFSLGKPKCTGSALAMKCFGQWSQQCARSRMWHLTCICGSEGKLDTVLAIPLFTMFISLYPL